MADNHTPFDNDLLHDPQAPRHTQPLAAGASTPATAQTLQPTTAPVAAPIAAPIAQQPTVQQPLPIPPTATTPTATTPTIAPPTVVPPTTFVATPGINANSRPLPPQVVSGNLNDDDDAPVAAPRGASNTGRLPTPTLIGLAMAGGAIGVTLLSAFFYSKTPRPAVKGLATATTVATPRPATTPRIVQMPADASSEDQIDESDSRPTASATTKNRAAGSQSPRPSTSPGDASQSNARDDASASDDSNNDSSSRNSSNQGFQGSENSEAGSNARNSDSMANGSNDSSGSRIERRSAEKSDSRTSDSRTSDSRTSDSGSSVSGSSDSGSNGARRNDSEGASAGRNNAMESPASGSGSNSGTRTGDGAFATRRGGYSITPPAGFRLVQSGRRTIWRGPGGAQILVETAPAGNRSPRRDWERMDAALAKKYGARYRSRGISDTSVAGRAAAVWEFELDGKNGTTRKLDVAVHHKGRGYAVLGSAPARNFDAVRPQLEAAINSFQIQEAAARAPSRRRNRPASSSSSAPATTGETARNDAGQDEYYAPNVDSTQSERGY